MNDALLISIRFHDGRYHGAGDWPPAPARLFQALVAGAARGIKLADKDAAALEWLERLDAPVIATPVARIGQSCKTYVPNNDLDAVSGELKRIGEIRTAKNILPHIFDSEIPLLFVWTFKGGEDDDSNARTICQLAEQLYQLGRGVDMAWAWAEVMDASEVETPARSSWRSCVSPKRGRDRQGTALSQGRIACKPQRAIRCKQDAIHLYKGR